MSQGLYSGVSGLALGTGLYRNVSGLWGGAAGLIDGFASGRPQFTPLLDRFNDLIRDRANDIIEAAAA